MLVAPFKVEVGRPGEVGMSFQHGSVADAGIEPDIQDVRLLGEAVATTFGTTVAGGADQQRHARTRRLRLRARPGWPRVRLTPGGPMSPGSFGSQNTVI